MKIIILTSVSAKNIYKVNYLTDRVNVVAKVIEKRPMQNTFDKKVASRKKMIKKYGLLKTINKLLYNKYKYYFIAGKQEETIRHLLFPNGAEVEYNKDIPTLEVPDINDTKCIEFISEHDPDIIAVCGTSVLRPEVFQLAKKGTINIHSGIIPEYRSADPIFWALYNNEPDKVGVTIHFVDKGVDTGPIIYQQAVGVNRDDNIATLFYKCNKVGAELMVKAIRDIENGTVKTINRDVIYSKAYYHMDLGIWQYIIFKWRLEMLRRTLRS
jgi:methionyl-tRNA formyltransferase